MESRQPAPTASDDDERRRPKKPTKFDDAVTWLLGSMLLRQIGWIALYSLFKRRLGGIAWMKGDVAVEPPPGEEMGGDEYWFDYIADSGDSQKATYSIAYLCLSDLYADGPLEPGRDLRIAPRGREDAPLPRGRFLFVGGDTAYHVANIRTLIQRFRNPFCWAYDELVNEQRRDCARRVTRLYAIPGNHDYYDHLGGFNAQFCAAQGRNHELDIPCFERAQDASYVAIRLPFKWWLLGLDTQGGEIDPLQTAFFRKLVDTHAPTKIIVATPEPTTVFHRRASEDEPIVASQRAIGLETPFLDPEPRAPEGGCRLDLSGDVHHYERYWGPPRSHSYAPHSHSYASVVSGLGGAFLHPSHTVLGDLDPMEKYPSEDVSRDVVNERLLNPWKIAQGGNVALMGFLLGLVMFGAWRSHGTSTFLQRLVDGKWALSPILAGEQGLLKSLDAHHGILTVTVFLVAAAGTALIVTAAVKDRSGALVRGGAYLTLVLLTLGTLVGILSSGFLAGFLAIFFTCEATRGFKAFKRAVDAGDDAPLPKAAYGAMAVLGFAPLIDNLLPRISSMLAPLTGGRALASKPTTDLTESTLLFVFCVLGAGMVAAAIWHRELLDERAKRSKIKLTDDFLSLFMTGCGLLAITAALSCYGDLPARTIALHQAFLAMASLVTVGLVLNALFVGAKKRRCSTKVGFGAIGLVHGVLQFGVPLLVTRPGASLLVVPVALAVAAVTYFVGKQVVTRRSPWTLTALWILVGTAVFVVLARVDPMVAPTVASRVGRFLESVEELDRLHGYHAHELSRVVSSLLTLVQTLVVAASTTLMTCCWFGWYLAVSLGFGGHNNEAGGAARIEDYKELVRIKLMRESLTAYVIGIDRVESEGERLRPRLVDVFTLRSNKERS